MKLILFKLKIFLWYLATEPFRQLKIIWFIIKKIIDIINRTITWAYIGLAGTALGFLLGDRWMTGLFLIFLLFVILSWEWKRGFYIARWRQKVEKKIGVP